MDELQALRDLAEELEKESNEKKQIALLQTISKLLLTDYEIKVGNTTIEPLWVEAYYYDQQKFPDYNTHMSDKQKGRFGMLYFHENGRGGFDICLSQKNNYYLSFLMKGMLINKGYTIQTGIYDHLKKHYLSETTVEQMKGILKRRAVSLKYTIIFSERVGLTKSCYKDSALAAYPLDVIRNYDFDFPTGCKKQWRYAIYALSKECDGILARRSAKRDFGSKIEDKYWNAAEESWDNSKKYDLPFISFKTSMILRAD